MSKPLTSVAVCLFSLLTLIAQAEPLPSNSRVPRLASLAPSVTEILYAIGAEDRLIGVSAQCDFPLAAKLKPKLGSFNRPDLEKLRAARPDRVLFAEFVRPEDLAALEREGIPSAVLSARDLADLAATVRKLGRIAGRSEKADSLAKEIEAAVAEVSSKVEVVPEGRRPSVYLEVDGPAKPYAVGPGSFMADLVRAAGGRNAFAEGPAPYFPVSAEDVLRVKPDVILIDHPFQYKSGLAKRPGWAEVPAVKNGRVYDATDFDMILLNRPGPRVVRSLREVARLLHPEVFRGP